MRFFLLALLLVTAAHAQPGSFLPRDAGADDPTFIAFRGRLIEAVARRDTVAVLGALAPDVKVSFGDGGGHAGFRRIWLSDSAQAERLWATLGRVLGMGSARYSGGISAPYVFGAWPDSLDAFEHGAVVGEEVRVRAGPGTAARTIGSASFEILPVTRWRIDGPGGPWAEVRLPSGYTGYIAQRYLWSPIDFRIGFERRPDGWAVSFFLAGD
jgi:hypothetical protein